MLTMRLAVSVDPGSREDGSLQMCGLIEANWPSGFKQSGSSCLILRPHQKMIKPLHRFTYSSA